MAKRGRPAHPDILTPREWEVLDLLREGHSNEDIGERLGISISGVKFHVTEILGKLGLDNRADAARWKREQARPWWLNVAAPLLLWRRLGSGWASGVIAGALLVAVAAGAGILVWALIQTSEADGDKPVDVPDVGLAGLTAENFAARFTDALSRDGLVAHMNITASGISSDGVQENLWTTEAWLDMVVGVSREEFRKDPQSDADIGDYLLSIASSEAQYFNDGTETWSSPVDACPGLTQVLASTLNALLQCAGSEGIQRTATSIEVDATYEGVPAVAFVATDANESEGGPTRIEGETTSTFYVDRHGFLPLALVIDYRDLVGDGGGTGIYNFDSEFVPSASLPDDFFEPSSIGYAPPTPTPVCDPEAALDEAGLTVYWLGREFASSGLLPQLTLACSFEGEPPGGGPGYRLGLEYEASDGSRPISIWLWRPEDWQPYNDEALSATAFTSACGSQQELTIPGGNAIIYAAFEPEQPPRPATPEGVAPGTTLVAETPVPGPDRTPTSAPQGPCPDRPFDLYTAVAYFENTVVTINMPHCIFCLGRSGEPDYYDSRDGMEAIVRALRLRE